MSFADTKMMMQGSSNAVEPTVDGATYDGTDFQDRNSDFTGASDGTTFIFSCWFRPVNFVEFRPFIFHIDSRFYPYVENGTGKVFCEARNTAGAQIQQFKSTVACNLGEWNHVVMAVDTNVPSQQLYLNGVSSLESISNSTGTLDFTAPTGWNIAAYDDGANGKWIGDLAEIYFAPNQYLDLSNPANRAKFLAGTVPANLGSDGSTPTGSAPILYQHLDIGEAVANFATNKGTGGNATLTGTLVTAAQPPILGM